MLLYWLGHDVCGVDAKSNELLIGDAVDAGGGAAGAIVDARAKQSLKGSLDHDAAPVIEGCLVKNHALREAHDGAAYWVPKGIGATVAGLPHSQTASVAGHHLE